MPRPPRFLIADDNPTLRLGIAALIDREPAWRLAGEAADRAGLLKLAGKRGADLVIADIFQPSFSGLELPAEVRQRSSRTKVLVFSAYDEVLFAERAVRAGASGYVMKREPAEVLLKAVRQILKGGIFVSPRATGNLLHRLAGRPAESKTLLQPLSDRELEVLRRMGEGYQSREIAHAMQVSIKTVEAHREHIKAKLGVGSSPELLRLSLQWVRIAGEDSLPSRS